MDIIEDRINSIKRFEADTDRIILDMVKAHEQKILALNTKEQLYQGVDANNKRLTPPYAPATIKYKKQNNQPYNRVTLRDQSDFYQSFIIEYGQKSFTIKATDHKGVYLERKYGDILGLTDTSVGRVIDLIKPNLLTEVKAVLNAN